MVGRSQHRTNSGVMKLIAVVVVAAAAIVLLLGPGAPTTISVRADSTSPECRSQMKTCAPGAPCADLIIDGARAQSSVRVAEENIATTSCAVVEGCTQPGHRKLMRFDLAVLNVGSADLPVGVPSAPSLAPCFTWSSCHAHYHFTAFANYQLINTNTGAVVGRGAKASSCLQDAYRQTNPGDAPLLQSGQTYWCANQGIHRGYQDVYGAHLDCQWIDVTGVTPGTYTLRLSVNDAHVLAENNYGNNVVSFPVVVPADSGAPNPPTPTACPMFGGCSSCAEGTGCGWCGGSPGVAAGCTYGSYLGPASGTCTDWKWNANDCAQSPVPPASTCSPQRTCSSCAAVTGCGWCPTTNTCEPGTITGPVNRMCPSWQFGPNNQCGNCGSFNACGGCTAATGCGFCKSSGVCSAGTWLGPAGLSCSSWAWSHSQCDAGSTPSNPPTNQASCTGSSQTRTGRTAAGTCPSGTSTLSSGSTCQLACSSGYSRTSGGLQTCTNGVWSGTQPSCTPNSCTMPAAPAGTSGGCGAPGSLLSSGSSCTYTVQSGWSLQSGFLTRTCLAGSFTTAAPVLGQSTTPPPTTPAATCAAQHTCNTCAAVSGCGWCPTTNTCEPGTLSGPLNRFCAAWQFGPNNQCGNCGSFTSCNACSGATGCGFCADNNVCSGGTWLGPAGKTCQSWVWSSSKCSAPPPSIADSCNANHDCSSCTNTRDCGWCPASAKCSHGTWTGPVTGTCSAWVWSADVCTNPSAGVSRVAGVSRSMATTGALPWSRIKRTGPGAAAVSTAEDDPAATSAADQSHQDESEYDLALDALISSRNLAEDPRPFVAALGLSLDETLKADASGNIFKRPSAIDANLKFSRAAAAGNCLKDLTDVDLDIVERPDPEVVAARSAAAAAAATATSTMDDEMNMDAGEGEGDGTTSSLPVAIDPWDPSPFDASQPHGHREALHMHLDSSGTATPNPSGSNLDPNNPSLATGGTAPTVSEQSLMRLVGLCGGIALMMAVRW